MQNSTKQALAKVIDSGKIPSPILFYGADNSSMKTAACQFLSQMIDHPCDITTYVPEGKANIHTIESMKSFSKSIHLPPYQSKYRGFIIEQADRLTDQSGNAILKALEEAPAYCLVILLAQDEKKLLPTIQSRLVKFRFSKQEPQTNFDLSSLKDLEGKSYSEQLEIFEKIDEIVGKDAEQKRLLLDSLTTILPPSASDLLDTVQLALEHHMRPSTACFYLYNR